MVFFVLENIGLKKRREAGESSCASGRPVVMFFHGGGHETGTVGELPYGTCTEYAKRGVIFVSVGYRLNVFFSFQGKELRASRPDYCNSLGAR